LDIKKVLNQAFNLGQIYWQQVDSDSFIQYKKADVTMAKFKELVSQCENELKEKEIPRIPDCEERVIGALRALNKG